jgi:RNA polymerase sigma factor (sigma-70 family)
MATSLTCDFDRTTVCEQFKPLVNSTVNKLNVAPEMREDAEQEGMIGLLKAYDRYDPDSPVHFSVYARPYVKGAIIRGIFGQPMDLDLVPVGDSHDLALIEDPDPDPEARYIESLMLREWLDSLAPKDGWLIWRRFWQGATSAEIAGELSHTAHWVNERQQILIGRAAAFLGAN